MSIARDEVVNTDATKDRLLDAAGEEFAALGFEGATIRSICRRAEANLAAVNYHFGDKERLYYEAVMAAHQCELPQEPSGLEESVAAPEQLRHFIRHFLEQIVAVNRAKSWHHDLMLREMIRPTAACDSLTQDMIRPRFLMLRGILDGVAPGLNERQLDALCFTVIGQCLFYRVGTSIASRLVGAERWSGLDPEYLTDHITRSSLAAVSAAAQKDSVSP